jgi:hypothetical protein
MPTAEADQVQISASGHSRQKCDVRDTSAYPPIATAERTWRDVSNVPRGDIHKLREAAPTERPSKAGAITLAATGTISSLSARDV